MRNFPEAHAKLQRYWEQGGIYTCNLGWWSILIASGHFSQPRLKRRPKKLCLGLAHTRWTCQHSLALNDQWMPPRHLLRSLSVSYGKYQNKACRMLLCVNKYMLNYVYNNTNHKVPLCVVLLFQQNFIEYRLSDVLCGSSIMPLCQSGHKGSSEIAEPLGTIWHQWSTFLSFVDIQYIDNDSLSSQARISYSRLKRRPRKLCSDLAHTQGGHAWEPRLSLSRYLSNINGR